MKAVYADINQHVQEMKRVQNEGLSLQNGIKKEM